MSSPVAKPKPPTHEEDRPQLPDLYRDIHDDLLKVDGRLREWMESSNPLIAEAGKYIFEDTGKKIRPALVLLTSRMSGYEGAESVYLAALIEVIHTASLIHDDIIDNALFRRGKKSVHAKWGPNITVLLGDYLFIKSIGLSLQSRFGQVIHLLADVSAKMIEGEIMEYYFSGNLGISEEEYLDVIGKKTAALFSVSCRIGAVLGGVSAREESLLAEYGENLGLSFQIIDDLLDFTGQENVLGKPTLSDLAEGRITLPLIHALGSDGGPRQRSLAGLVKKKKISSQSRDRVLEILASSGSLDYAFRRAKEYAERSQKIIRLFPESSVRTKLMGLADYVLKRDK